MSLIDNKSSCLSLVKACENIPFPKSSYYRLKKGPQSGKVSISPRRLAPNERQEVLDVFH